MSGGDSLVHECQTGVEDIFAHVVSFLMHLCTYKHNNTVHNTPLRDKTCNKH